MKRTACIDFHGVPLSVEFDYHRGYAGNRIDPPEPEMAEISSIKAGAIDITDIFTEDQLFEVGDACIQWVNDEREHQMHEHADMLREERALGNA